MAIIDRIVRQEEALATPDLIALHLTGLGLFALLYETLQPAYPDFRGGLAALIALGAIALWQWLQTRDRVASLNAAALAFTLAALGVAVQFDGPAVVIGWAAEGAAAVWMGLRAPNVTFQYRRARCCGASRSWSCPMATSQRQPASPRSSTCATFTHAFRRRPWLRDGASLQSLMRLRRLAAHERRCTSSRAC